MKVTRPVAQPAPIGVETAHFKTGICIRVRWDMADDNHTDTEDWNVNSELSYPASDVVEEIATDVASLLEQSRRCAALRHAITATDPLLRTPSDALRIDLHQKIFKQFSKQGVS